MASAIPLHGRICAKIALRAIKNHDIINSANSQTANADFKGAMSNCGWLYYCSSEDWDKLNEVRAKVSTFSENKKWTVIGESFDNAGLSITAACFKESQRAV